MKTKIFHIAGWLIPLLCAGLSGQTPNPLPVTVHTDPTGEQLQPAAVLDSLGRMLVVWRDSSDQGELILVQGFDQQGSRLGNEQIADLISFRKASHPSLAVDYNGGAVLAWDETLGSINRIQFRRYNVFGVPKGSEPLPQTIQRLINGKQPAVAADSTGNLILVWQDNRDGTADIFGNWYAFDDTSAVQNTDSVKFAWIGDLKINSGDSGEQTDPAVAADRKGNLLVAWRDSRPDSAGIFCRLFTDKGLSLAGFRLPSGPPDSISDLSAPAVSAIGYSRDSSSFLISWVQRDIQGANRLYLARAGIAFFFLSQVATLDSTPQIVRARPGLEFARPSLSGNETWDLALVWSENDADGRQVYGISGNLANGTVTPAGRITETGANFGTPAAHPVVAVRRDGGFVMVWEDLSRQDTDLRMQRFNSAGEPLAPLYLAPGGSLGQRSGNAAVMARRDGGFSLFWEGDTGSGVRIQMTTYDSAGRTLIPPGPLDDNGWEQKRPVLARNSAGMGLLAWEEGRQATYRISALLLASDGSTVKSPFVLAQSAASHLGGVAAALRDDGKAYLVWERWAPLAEAPDLVLGRLDSLGNPSGSPSVVAAAANGGGRLASVAVAPEGSHMVAWRQGAGDGSNAQVLGRIYNPQGGVARDRLPVSEQKLSYLGSVSRPVVAASPVTGKFLALWNEFFSDRQHLYYRLYSVAGDSLDLDPDPEIELYRHQLDSAGKGSGGLTSQSSPTVEADSTGDYLVLWIESEAGGATSLLGVRIDSLGETRGRPFSVPGVSMASLPAVRILAPDRIAVAWQDTAGGAVRLLAVELDFHNVSGSIVLAGLAANRAPLYVHIEGNVTDSAAVGPDGRFHFDELIGGVYRIWITRGTERLEARRSSFTLGASDARLVDLGLLADLSGEGKTVLPRAAELVLEQNIPNPFNPSTTVSFSIPGSGERLKVTLGVYDLRGALVKTLADRELESGAHTLVWDGRNERGDRLASGVYFLRLKAAGETRVRKMILLK